MAKKNDSDMSGEGKTEKKAVAVKRIPSRKPAASATADSLGGLKDLAAPAPAAEDAVAAKAEAEAPKADEPRKPMIDAQGRSYGTGRRKGAVARVWVKPGKGAVTVNGRDQKVYFARQTQRLVLNQPFLITNRVGQFDVICTVAGGGLSGQAGAVRHGIARALQNYDPDLRGALKKAGMLTRDARTVERKKIGLHKARRSKQWAKR